MKKHWGQRMNWINIKDGLPKHYITVLAYSPKGQCVCVFIDTVEMNKELLFRGFPIDQSNTPYRFCSQEIKGNILNGVTHWMPLPNPPEE
jgi:hypothetical protein